jgi:hypothetical protein
LNIRLFSAKSHGAKALNARTISMVAAVVLISLAIVEGIVLFAFIDAPGDWSFGMDYRFYRDLGQQWLADGSFYRPHQLAGPYDVALMTDVLYPPIALLVFVPLTVIPAPVWWLVPLASLAVAWWRWAPAPWTWPIALLLLLWPRSMATFYYGNADMWVLAGVAGGLLGGWPAVLVLLKPTLAPLALVGVRHRSWWVIPVAALAHIALTAPLWFDYFTAMRNLRIGWEYSVGSLPLVLIPIVLWLGRSRQASGDPVGPESGTG